MNGLSWLIYAADVADNLDWFLWWIMFFSTVGGMFWVGVGICAAGDGSMSADEWKIWRRVGFYALAPAFFLGTIMGSIVPSKETIYAIAASEMGEEVLNSKTGNKAVGALNAWLDRQITGEEPTETENNSE